MSIGGLFDHRAVCYRLLPPTDARSRGDAGQVIELYEEATTPSGLNARLDQAWAGTLQDRGPGEREGEYRTWYLHKGFDVQARDVLLIASSASGVNVGVKVRVLGVTPCTAPKKLHHYEVNVDVYDGPITVAPAES